MFKVIVSSQTKKKKKSVLVTANRYSTVYGDVLQNPLDSSGSEEFPLTCHCFTKLCDLLLSQSAFSPKTVIDGDGS